MPSFDGAFPHILQAELVLLVKPYNIKTTANVYTKAKAAIANAFRMPTLQPVLA